MELNGQLFFKGKTEELGYELWKTDGTEAGTVLVKDINPGMNGSTPYSSTPNFLCSFDNKVFFAAKNQDSGTQLWSSDGTIEGTVLFYGHDDDATWNPRNLMNFNNRFYFTMNTSAFGQPYLYSFGSSTETPAAHEALDFQFMTYNRAYGSFFTLKNTLCFQANLESNTGAELYKLVDYDETGISTIFENNISVYPNPTTDFVKFDFKEKALQSVSYTIIDINGKIIDKQSVNTSNYLILDLSNFKSGLYNVSFNVNNKSFSKTVVRK